VIWNYLGEEGFSSMDSLRKKAEIFEAIRVETDKIRVVL
jgi:hypothetical protein